MGAASSTRPRCTASSWRRAATWPRRRRDAARPGALARHAAPSAQAGTALHGAPRAGRRRAAGRDGRPFHDAPLRPATLEEVGAWQKGSAPPARPGDRRAALAHGVPFELDAGGFGRHTFLCGQSGSGKTYSLGVLLERLLMETRLRVVVLDPNSDYVRLSETRADVDAAAAARYRERAGRIVVRQRRGAAMPGSRPLPRAHGRRCRRRCCASTRSPTATSTPSWPRWSRTSASDSLEDARADRPAQRLGAGRTTSASTAGALGPARRRLDRSTTLDDADPAAWSSTSARSPTREEQALVAGARARAALAPPHDRASRSRS